VIDVSIMACMEYTNYIQVGPMDASILHSAQFNPVEVTDTDSSMLIRKEPCGGTLMSHGSELGSLEQS